jgi:hypothetical protein
VLHFSRFGAPFGVEFGFTHFGGCAMMWQTNRKLRRLWYMAKHEFGIMMNTPRQSERYDEYEPWKYECISVDDKDLEGVVERLSSIDFYWHTLSVKGKGLAYCGVTLVPPCSLKAFIDSIADIPELCELKKLLKKALDKNKWVIHYGI